MVIQNRPDAFQPFSNVRIGNNTFVNTQALLTIGGFAPLLIGEGDAPRIWLSVPPAQPGGDWLALVADNSSSLPDLTVSANKRLIRLAKGKTGLLNAVVAENGDLVFHMLDLRPVGLNIFVDDHALHIFDSTLTQNQFNGMPVVFALQ